MPLICIVTRTLLEISIVDFIIMNSIRMNESDYETTLQLMN